MVRRNIVANTLGKGWSMFMGLVFVPLYIKFLGMEAYGLIGFFATLQMVFSVLDLGLSTTLNRELARASAHPEQAEKTRDLVRTLEFVYWGIAVIIGATVIGIAPLIAHKWLNPKGLSVSSIEHVVVLLGLVTAFQWPIGFYSGGLMGLQRQMVNNVITSGLATARGAGAVLVLWLVSPTIEVYFQWQLVISMLGVAWFAITLWKSLPQDRVKARFRIALLRSVWSFAAGMTGISFVTLLLTQTDKILLSTLLPLEVFGYYTLAGAVASASVFVVGPMFNAVFPRFSQLASLGDSEQLKALYHRACQLTSVAVLPTMMVVTFFSFELLLLWTRNPLIAERAHWLVSLLAIGTALNGLMYIPYALQLAHGWTRLAFTANVIGVFLLVPLIFVLATHFGAVGAAVVWVLLNTGYVVFAVPAMHRRLLKGEMGYWYKVDIGRPLVGALPVVVLARVLYSQDVSSFGLLAYLVGVGLTALTGAALATPTVRALTAHFIARQSTGRLVEWWARSSAK